VDVDVLSEIIEPLVKKACIECSPRGAIKIDYCVSFFTLI